MQTSSPTNSRPSPLCGLLNVNKPAGMSSRQAVSRIERLVQRGKVGHAGTLDPLATGVLVVCVGGATRLIEYVHRMTKGYVGAFLLGRQSPTEDIEGEITELPDAPAPTLEQIQAATRRFLGPIEQRPPAFSALKVHGRPAYRLARQGKPPELSPRTIEVFRFDVKEYAYPKLVLEIECGSGTYVRSLGRDLAASLGTAAVMAALTRTRIGPFRIEDALDLNEPIDETIFANHLQPPFRAVEYLPTAQLSADDSRRIRNGLTLEPRAIALSLDQRVREVAAIDPHGELIGVIGPLADGRWHTLRNLPTGT